jgi:hypothetical protein
LSTQPGNPNDSAGKGARPRVVIGILATTALAVVIAALVFKSKTPATGLEAPVAAPSTANPGETASPGSPSFSIPADSGPSKVATSEGAPLAPRVATQAGAATLASINDLVKILKDASQPISQRKKAIKELAQLGSPEAIAALKDALTSGSNELRLAVAEGLGNCASAECTTTLLGLLNDQNEAMVKAAVRGLALQASPQAMDALTKLLYDSSRSADVRSAAAMGLATIEQPSVTDTLAQAARNITDPDIVTEMLNALGTRNFSETETFFQSYLRSSTVSPELRVAALEGLSEAKGDPSAFLVSMASDLDPDVRTAAAWALSATDASGKAGTQLLGLLQGESDASVRLRLYEALGNQESVDVSSVMAAVQNEKDPSARIAGLDLLAKTLRDNPSPQLQTFFDQTAIPELKQTALTGTSKSDQMAAGFARGSAEFQQPGGQAIGRVGFG